MKKHERARLRGIKFQQKIAATKKQLRAAYIAGGLAEQELPHDASNEVLVRVVQAISRKRLKTIVEHQGYFANFPGLENLVRLAKDEVVLRDLQISKQ